MLWLINQINPQQCGENGYYFAIILLLHEDQVYMSLLEVIILYK